MQYFPVYPIPISLFLSPPLRAKKDFHLPGRRVWPGQAKKLSFSEKQSHLEKG